MPAEQSFKNHARFDPIFHFFLLPLALANVIRWIYITIHLWPIHSGPHLWRIVMSFVLFMAIGITRGYANKNQDRIIRLEERLRYVTLLPTDVLTRANSLSLKQIIGLRFASDAELPTLIQRALAENLTQKQIKQAIQNWRADNARV
jgi:hypothetical protein